MKFLLTLLIILTITNCFAADAIDGIELILPTSYARKTGTAQDLKSSSAVWFGDLVGMADISKTIYKSLNPYQADLIKYFPASGELDLFVNKLVAEANRDIVKNDMDDKKAIAVNKFFGNQLVGNIFEKILEKEGVTSPERRAVWKAKLLAPFNSCIDRATNSLYAASHCMDALTSSLVPNTGTAIAFEMSKEKLSSALPVKDQLNFNLGQAQIYKDCISKLKPSSENVFNCVLKSMKNGVLKVTNLKLTKTITDSASTPAIAKSIQEKVWPIFSSCINEINAETKNPNKQIESCIDTLIQNTGTKLVSDKLVNTTALKLQFSSLELKKLANEKVEKFKKCTDDLISNNIRKDGMIDTDICQNRITNDVTYKVVIDTFNKSVKEMLPNQSESSLQILSSIQKSLDLCWDENQDAKKMNFCIKSNTILMANKLATIKLQDAIPKTIKNKDQVITSSLDELNSCLQKGLSANISEATNTRSKISECTDRLTKNTALIVASSEVKSALTGKLSEKEIDASIEKFVKSDFNKCIGSTPTEKVIEACADQLKINVSEQVLDVSLNQYLGNRPGIDLANTRNALKTKLLNNFKQCLKTSLAKDECTDELSRDADQRIVLSYGRVEASIQLSSDKLPTKLDTVENNFTNCTTTKLKGKELSDLLDECNKKFALEFAKTLGNIKLKYLMEQALGTKTVTDQAESLNKISQKYEECLNDLYKYKMEDGLTEKISICTTDLTNKALGLVRSNLFDWMSTSQRDATTISVKSEFAGIIPCLSVLMPSSPYSQSNEKNVESILIPVAQLLGQFIEYSPENARNSLREIMDKLRADLSSTNDTELAKNDILDLLYKNGGLDQFIKSMVRGKVKDAFNVLSEKDLPKSVRDQLTAKQNFDTIFNSNEGIAIKDIVFKRMLKPILLKGEDLKSPAIAFGLENVNDEVVKLLVSSPKFGEVIVKSGIQNQIDNMGGFTKFMAKTFYGSDNLIWEKVRESDQGKIAEEYIKQKLLTPKFSGIVLSPSEEKNISLEAEKLVKEAVKKYKAP